MNKGINTICFVIVFIALNHLQANADQLTFRFTNPAFGGNPYNYSWMLESASVQNQHEEDPLEDFENTLNQRILSSLASRIVDSAFGSYGDPLQSGQYQFGDYNITITNGGSGVNVDIFDQGSGATTSVSVPNY